MKFVLVRTKDRWIDNADIFDTKMEAYIQMKEELEQQEKYKDNEYYKAECNQGDAWVTDGFDHTDYEWKIIQVDKEF